MKKVLLSAVVLSSLSFAAGFMDMGMSGDMHIMLSSDKVLSEGQNKIKIELNKGGHGGADVKAKDVRVKFFMPEMPGMPYMESKDICKKTDTYFECNVNFGMSGTWQYQVFIKDENNKDYKYKGSVNLGQASSMHSHH
ncbi:MAG: FixH family protein [Sulfurimonas sp.]|uniref:FixH family protein n=1 Tax=Sulfurimonas sp. TaxID=2022749 RepID=UPI0026098F82|nr:FixH family protein [Sulfurimonas sp.]MDD2651441.1 FixH family protein [Sulfurimonas sp.]MDD3450982.1 FixH family protein [Sulfurimonas sp.]